MLLQVFIFSQAIWIAPIVMAVVTYLVYIELGWSAFLVIGYFLINLPLQIFLGKSFAYLRYKELQ